MARSPTRAQRAALDALLATWEPRIRESFMAAVYHARGQIDLAALIDAIERRDLLAAEQIVRLNQGALWPLQEAIRQAAVAGAMAVPGMLGIEGRFGFDGRHPRAETLLRDAGAELVQGIEADTLEATRAVIVDGIENSRPSRVVAREITGTMNPLTRRREGGIIGLTSEQTDYVINARRDLMTLDRRYFTRARRDKRFDALVRRAIESGKPLAAKYIDRIVGRYKDRLLAYRGDAIARNEAHSAQAAGRDEAFRQMLDDPEVEAVTVRWQHSPQRRPRPDHVGMDGKTVRLGEDFILPDGARMAYPHDPRGGAKHSIFCKCIAIYKPVWRRD